MTPDEWRARGELWQWRGHDIFTHVEGKGDPLLLIHGFPTASWDWHPLWPALVKRFKVITLDMIGFGFSAKPKLLDYRIDVQADLYEAFLVNQHVTSYHLLAHDYGLTVTQELLARQHNARAKIRSACLLNGGLFPETHRAALTQKLLASGLGSLVAKVSSFRTFSSTMRSIWGKTPVTEDDLRSMWRLVRESDGMSIMPRLIRYMEERRQHRERWVGAIVHAKIPIRLVDGLDDPISGAHMVARYRELVPNPDIVELPGVGHYPQLEASEAVLAAALEHFERSAA